MSDKIEKKGNLAYLPNETESKKRTNTMGDKGVLRAVTSSEVEKCARACACQFE